MDDHDTQSDSPPVAWACKKCNSPRAVDPCQKCGTALTKPADGWEWPGLPDIDRIRELAREVGYAVGVHGTMERDLDLIAAPWVAEAVSPAELAQHIAQGLGGSVINGDKQDKPCGRWSCNIHTPDWTKLIDLSVMPPALATRDEAPAEAGDEIRRSWEILESIPAINDLGSQFQEDIQNAILAALTSSNNWRVRIAIDALTELKNVGMVGRARSIAAEALSALRAQPQAREEAQPVAWRMRPNDGLTYDWAIVQTDPNRTAKVRADLYEVEPLFATPPAPEAEKLRDLLERHQEERRMIRMKDTGAVYDTTLDLDTRLALAALQQEGRDRGL